VGEAVKNLPQEVKEAEPEIEWAKIAGFRDVLVHGYFGVDHDIVWDVVENRVQPLAAAAERQLPETREAG
jgi:uncharacterized protein with HEPN domain